MISEIRKRKLLKAGVTTGNLPLEVGPKLTWAERHKEIFPLFLWEEI